MPSKQVIERQDDFSSGMIRDVSPPLIPANGAYTIRNGLLAEDGAIFERGGTEAVTDAAFGSRLTFLWDGTFEAGERTLIANPDDFGVIAQDGHSVVNLGSDGLPGPRVCALLEGMLFIGGGYIYAGARKAGPYATGTVSVTQGDPVVNGVGVTWNTLVEPGMLFQIGNERVYVVKSIDSATKITLSDPYEGSSGTGKPYTLTGIYKITSADPYEAANFYAVVQNRLVWGVGNEVRFSAIRAPHSRRPTEDFHRLPEGAQVISTTEVGPNAVVFSTFGIWVIEGMGFDIADDQGNPQHRVSRLSPEILFGGPGVAKWDQIAVVPFEDGVHLVDGISTPQKISDNIDPLYLHYTQQGFQPGTAEVFRNHYFLPILNALGEVDRVLILRLDRQAFDKRRRVTFPWSYFDSSGGTLTAFATSLTGPADSPRLLATEGFAHSRVVDLTNVFIPAQSNALDADGSHWTFDIVTRDYTLNSLSEARLRRVRLHYEMQGLEPEDDPRLYLSWGDGTRDPLGPKWGDPAGVWGVGFGPSGVSPWTAAESLEFAPVAIGAPQNDGRTPHSYRVNQGRLRMVRLRFRKTDPTTKCVVRVLELFVLPTETLRR